SAAWRASLGLKRMQAFAHVGALLAGDEPLGPERVGQDADAALDLLDHGQRTLLRRRARAQRQPLIKTAAVFGIDDVREARVTGADLHFLREVSAGTEVNFIADAIVIGIASDGEPAPQPDADDDEPQGFHGTLLA